MNSDLKENGGRSEKSWRYVHHEMDEQERREFERLLGSDEALRQKMDQIRHIHDNLRELMPLTEQTEEMLADRIQQEWERSTVNSSPSARKKVWAPFVECIRTTIEAWRWRPYALKSLAAVVAAVLLAVGIRAYLAGPLEWMRPEISVGVRYRGGEPEKAPSYSRDEFLDLHQALRQSVEKYLADTEGTEHTRSWLGREKKWRLAAKYQELPEGGTQVQVTLYSSRYGTRVKEWSNYYPDLRSFENQLDELGKQIVKELVATEPATH
jgi:hypothetical protein